MDLVNRLMGAAAPDFLFCGGQTPKRMYPPPYCLSSRKWQVLKVCLFYDRHLNLRNPRIGLNGKQFAKVYLQGLYEAVASNRFSDNISKARGQSSSEERRLGQACVSTCRYRWSP